MHNLYYLGVCKAFFIDFKPNVLEIMKYVECQGWQRFIMKDMNWTKSMSHVGRFTKYVNTYDVNLFI